MKLKLTDLLAILLLIVAIRLPDIAPPVSPVASFVIVERTADRSTLAPAVIELLQEVSKTHLCPVIDSTPVGPDGKIPADLVPFIDAVKDKPLPALAVIHKDATTTCLPLPATIDAIKEAVK